MEAERILLGGASILGGLAIIIFHEQLRKFGDWWSKYDPILRQGDWWTGKYTRGALLFNRVLSVLFGLALIIFGICILARLVD
jgi:hypothetical protein